MFNSQINNSKSWIVMGRAFVFFIILSLVAHPINAQRGKVSGQQKSSQLERQAESFLQEGKFEKALLAYRKLHNENEESPRLNFLLGYSYLNTNYGLEKAVHYLLESTELTTTKISEKAPLESYYYLALAYHQNNQYQLAVNYLDDLLAKIPENNQFFRKQVVNLKEYCHNALMLAQSSVKVDIQNIFELNSKFSDKNPLIFNEGKEIIFTSRRETLRRGKKAKNKSLDDNIYYARIENGEWTNPISLSSVNTYNDESACWVSKNGNYLILQRIEKNRSNIYYSERVNNNWSAPVKFPSPINSKNNETYGSLSPDGKYLFFTSDRKGGHGGVDIYVSEKLGTNHWSEPKNLGLNINTEFNEESPLMHENGVLFFCSEGHVSMGGFDIFASFKDNNGIWNKAANLGASINSINDDFFYQPMPHGQYAYTSSQRQGTKGQSDIFKYFVNDSTGKGYALVTGKINCSRDIELDKNVEIVVRELKGKYKVKKYRTNKYGDFALVLSAANEFEISYLYRRQVFYQARMKFPKSHSFLASEQSIRLKSVELSLYDDTDVVRADKVGGKVEFYASEEKTTKTIKDGSKLVAAELTKKNNNFTLTANSDVEDKNAENSDVGGKYSIKLVSSKSKMLLSFFDGIEGVKEYQDDKGYYIYYFGEYNYEWEAEIKLRLISENYPEATVFVNRFANKAAN